MVQNVFFQETLTQGTAVIALDHGGYRGRCYYSAKIPHGLPLPAPSSSLPLP